MKLLLLLALTANLSFIENSAAADDDAILCIEDAALGATTKMTYHLYQKYPKPITLVAMYPLLYIMALALNPNYTSHSVPLEKNPIRDYDEILKAFREITPIITSSGVVDADFALRVYGDLCNPFNDNFACDVEDLLRTRNCGTSGRVQSIDYKFSAHAAELINYGVKQEATQCDIGNENIISANIVENYKNNSVEFIAVYNFHGNWEYPFNPKYTKNCDFDTGYGEIVQVPLMYRVGIYGYASLPELDAQLLEVIYKCGRFSLLFIFPNNACDFPELVKQLEDPYVFKSALARRTKQELQIYIAKGETCKNVDLLKNFKEITGYDDLFSGDVNKLFASGCNANIADILENVHLKVDEGSGATDYEMLNASSHVPIVRVDRAFLYYVLERTDSVDSPVLAGTFVNPYVILTRE